MEIRVLGLVACTLCRICGAGAGTLTCTLETDTLIAGTPPALLQARQKVSKYIETAKAKTTDVTPMDCEQLRSSPLQVLLNTETGTSYDLMALDVDTGHYTMVFPIPFTRTTPPYKRLNSCAISPITHLAYCTLALGGKGTDIESRQLLVRIDAEKIEFVARLPWMGTGAGFSPSGENLYITRTNRGDGGFYRITSPDSLVGCEDYVDPSLTDLSKTQTYDSPGLDDLVVFTKDLEGHETDYLLGIPKIESSIKVALIQATGDATSILIDTVSDGSVPNQMRSSFGAAWTFGTSAFFSNNRGEGVLKVDLKPILTKSIGGDMAPLKIEKVGASDSTFYNDGINCIGDAPPKQWQTDEDDDDDDDDDTDCSNGQFTNDEGDCQDCPAGKFSFEAGAFCTECDNGFYIDHVGATECHECPEGFVTLERGSTSCVEDPNYVPPTPSDCVDTNNGASGLDGKECAQYTQHPSYCDYPEDDDDFTAHEMCCACQGGSKP